MSASQDCEATDTGFAGPQAGAEFHQAAGMIMSQLDVNIDDAYFWLRTCARQENRPLIEIAHEIVDRQRQAYPRGAATT